MRRAAERPDSHARRDDLMPHTRHEDVTNTAADVTPVLPPSRVDRIRHGVAHWISAIIHPVFFPLLTILVLGMAYTHNDIRRTAELAGLAIALTALPVSLLVFIQVKRGVWSDLDVSRRTQRYTLYPLILLCAAALAYVYFRINAPKEALAAVFALLFANIINGLINLVWKISAHATTAAVCAALLWDLPLVHTWGPPAATGAILVSWSRVELGRHTTGQVIAGCLVGVGAAVSAIYLSNYLFPTL